MVLVKDSGVLRSTDPDMAVLNHRTLLELTTAEARFVTAKVISKLL